ncbi:cobalt-precorrin 5A acetaldehyde-lyase [Desulforamulus putei DSM 12395]|uniref:Cobalt-precorrin 5A acetaldehyde-lyase n=1 Tax=Desulforamulus putei DSM 12395 TaxID=1121429 RepID=A0A1M4TXJ5_9FIRM|nr:cobalt-precorrin 5A hydrolase [Desulforamulus putei]SHE49148.1 cobalt-precorrin 5A acetaldehyde-lyase [Desulforamulus putei DSM 12395]
MMRGLYMDIVRENRVAILALTKGGARLAGTLCKLLGDVQLYIPGRLYSASLPPDTRYFDNWQQAATEAFQRYNRLIFIMAAGIVVRTLAPLVQSKKTDPAVLVLDEKGRFAVSLLAGHLGGANQLAQRVAGLLRGTAVITTATDVNGVPAVELLARELDCEIYPAKGIKLFNRLLAEGERVTLCSRWRLKPEYRVGFTYIEGEKAGVTGPVVYITNQLVQPTQGPRMMLRPRNLVAGVGCRKGVSRQQVVSAVKAACKLGGFSLLSLKSLATVDLKMREPGLLEAARYFNVPLVEVTRQQIERLAGQFTPSDFVKDRIGVGGVCEPAAITASAMGRLKVAKQKLGPVTVAIAEAKLWWWD